MQPDPNHIDDLIAIYLAGEATPDEILFVEAWRDESDENRRYFNQFKLIFEKAAVLSPGASFDTDRAWERMRSKLSGRDREVKTISLAPGYRTFLRIAAAIVVLLTAGIVTYNYFRSGTPQPAEVLTSGKTTETDTLPDGSSVHLNRQTTIAYSFNPKKGAHVAKLVGEAYFNINHGDEKTFIVEAEGTFIRDIGTSFNVKAYPDSSTIEVVVEEGEVMFYAEGNPGIYLKANGKGIYDKKTRTFTVGEPDPNITAYKTKFFIFNNHSLAAVVETLNSVYSKKIRIDDNLRACKLTVSFNDEEPLEIATIIAETLGLSVSDSANVIMLKGPGCGSKVP